MARLYANENFPRQVAEELRNLGHDVLTVQETGKADQSLPDQEVLAFATNGSSTSTIATAGSVCRSRPCCGGPWRRGRGFSR